MSKAQAPKEKKLTPIEISSGDFLVLLNSMRGGPSAGSGQVHRWEIIDGLNFLIIQNAKVTGNIGIPENTLKWRNLKLKDCTFTGKVALYNTKINNFIIDSTFSDHLDFSKGKFHSIKFTGGEYENQVNFNEVHVSESVEFNGGTFRKNVNFKGSEFAKPVRFTNGNFEQIQIDNGTFKEGITISSIEVKKNFIFNGGTYDKPVFIYGGTYLDGI